MKKQYTAAEKIEYFKNKAQKIEQAVKDGTYQDWSSSVSSQIVEARMKDLEAKFNTLVDLISKITNK